MAMAVAMAVMTETVGIALGGHRTGETGVCVDEGGGDMADVWAARGRRRFLSEPGRGLQVLVLVLVALPERRGRVEELVRVVRRGRRVDGRGAVAVVAAAVVQLVLILMRGPRRGMDIGLPGREGGQRRVGEAL